MSPLLDASIYKLLPIIFALRFPSPPVRLISPRLFPDASVMPIVNSASGSFHPINAFLLGSCAPLFIKIPVSLGFVVEFNPAFNTMTLSDISKFWEFICVGVPFTVKLPVTVKLPLPLPPEPITKSLLIVWEGACGSNFTKEASTFCANVLRFVLLFSICSSIARLFPGAPTPEIIALSSIP